MIDPDTDDRPTIPVVAILPELARWCCRCEQIIPAGTRLLAQGRRFWHEGKCPPRWTPRLLNGGGGDGEPVQLAFGLLGSIDGDGS